MLLVLRDEEHHDGEGGVVTTDDDTIADAVRTLRDQGQENVYEYVRPGFNLRMTELHAALGVAQMTRLGTVNDKRRKNAAVLHAGLCGIEGIVVPVEGDDRTHVFHQFTVRVTADAKLQRDDVLAALAARGIRCGVYYPRPVYDYACFRSDPWIGNPYTPRGAVRAEVLSIPVHNGLEPTEVDHIVESIWEGLGLSGNLRRRLLRLGQHGYDHPRMNDAALSPFQAALRASGAYYVHHEIGHVVSADAPDTSPLGSTRDTVATDRRACSDHPGSHQPQRLVLGERARAHHHRYRPANRGGIRGFLRPARSPPRIRRGMSVTTEHWRDDERGRDCGERKGCGQRVTSCP